MTRKEQIHQVARGMFRERGYMATSMRDIAKAVGIEAASLYNHIKSKEEILWNTCESIADELIANLDEVKDRDLPADKKLTQAIVSHIEIVAQNLDAAAVAFHEYRFLDEKGGKRDPNGGHYKKFMAMRKYYRHNFQKIIQTGVEEGLFQPVDSKLFSLALFSAMNWIYNWYDPEGILTPKQLGQQFAFIMLEGVRKRSNK